MFISTLLDPDYQKGSFQCNNFKQGRKCELCNHMKDNVEFVYSAHFRTKYPVRGHLFHQPRTQQFKDRWFVYLINDDHCSKQYVGSTTEMYGRWSSHKSGCNSVSTITGLAAHFAQGSQGGRKTT